VRRNFIFASTFFVLTLLLALAVVASPGFVPPSENAVVDSGHAPDGAYHAGPQRPQSVVRTVRLATCAENAPVCAASATPERPNFHITAPGIGLPSLVFVLRI
jgi:hypothetical protein